MEIPSLHSGACLENHLNAWLKHTFRSVVAFILLMSLTMRFAQAQNVTGFNFGTYTSVDAGSLDYGSISNPFTITYSGGNWNGTKSLVSYTPVTTPATLSGYIQPGNMLELGAFVNNPPVALYTFAQPLPPTSVMFIQDVDALESFVIEFMDASGNLLAPSSIGSYQLSSPAVSTVVINPASMTVTAVNNVNYAESLSTFTITAGSVAKVRITQVGSRDNLRNSGTAEFYFAAPSPPTADDEVSLNNTIGSAVTLDLLGGDLLGSGSPVASALVTVDLIAPAGGSVMGNTITVPGQGEWTYVPATGMITFSPEAGFTGNPTPINYTLTENATGLSDVAQAMVMYGALPVKLVAFDAMPVEGRVHLTWTTTEESNSDYFQVERSKDGENWIAIGSERAMGESQTLTHYSCWDQGPFARTSYYRLKMVDSDQTFAYSMIRNVVIEQAKAFAKVYPVPALDRVYISGLDISDVKGWAIISLAGTIQKTGSTLTFPEIELGNIPAGHYILSITFRDGFRQTQKVIVGR